MASASTRSAVARSGARASSIAKSLIRLSALLFLLGTSSGCYLAHLARGQWSLLCARQPIAELMASPETGAELREHLLRVEQVRAFAAEIGLQVGDNYSSYADWPGDRVVTTLVATEPGRLEPVGHWFPIVGRVPYRGYFDVESAAREADRLRAQGLDVCEIPVRAYSTLGWFDDPVTGPMLRQDDPILVETLLHELLHATVFVAGEADWNEGVASFVGQEARVRFFLQESGPEAGARQRAAVDAERRLRDEILRLRREVETLYAEQPPGDPRTRRRAELEARTRARVAALPLVGSDPQDLANRLQLADACLALTGTYHADIPAFAALLAELDGDLPRFIQRAQEAAAGERPRDTLLGGTATP